MIKHIIETDIASSNKAGLVKVDDKTIKIEKDTIFINEIDGEKVLIVDDNQEIITIQDFSKNSLIKIISNTNDINSLNDKFEELDNKLILGNWMEDEEVVKIISSIFASE